MKITNKDVCMFTGGVVIGAAVCGVTVVYKFITSETFRPVLAKTIADKIYDSVFKNPRYVSYNRSKHVSYGRPSQVSYGRPNQVSYKSYYDRPRKSDREFETDIIFETRKDAEEALEDLLEILKRYGQVTVHDVYAIVGLTVDYKSDMYGWTDADQFTNVSVVRVRNGWMINLPEPVELTK